MMEEWRTTLFQLIHAAPRELPGIADTLVKRGGIDPILELSHAEKVFPHVFSLLNPHVDLSARYHEWHAQWEGIKGEAQRVYRLFRQALDDPLSHFFIKGPGMAVYYPPDVPRYSHDLDLCIRSLEELGPLGSALCRQGYDIRIPLQLQRDPASGSIIGGTRFEPPSETGFRGLETHVGALTMTMHTWIPYEWFVPHIRRVEHDGHFLSVLDREGTIVAKLASLVQRKRLFLRDFMDIRFLFDGSSPLDQDHIAEAVDRFQLYRAVHLVVRSYNQEPAVEMPPLFRELVHKLEGKKLAGSQALFRGHVWPYLRRHSPRPWRRLAYVTRRTLTQYLNEKNRLLYLLKQSDLLFGTKPYFENGAPVYFLKLNSLESAFEWKQIGRFEVLATPFGSFAAAKHALYSDEELDYLSSCMERELEADAGHGERFSS